MPISDNNGQDRGSARHQNASEDPQTNFRINVCSDGPDKPEQLVFQVIDGIHEQEFTIEIPDDSTEDLYTATCRHRLIGDQMVGSSSRTTSHLIRIKRSRFSDSEVLTFSLVTDMYERVFILPIPREGVSEYQGYCKHKLRLTDAVERRQRPEQRGDRRSDLRAAREDEG